MKTIFCITGLAIQGLAMSVAGANRQTEYCGYYDRSAACRFVRQGRFSAGSDSLMSTVWRRRMYGSIRHTL